MTSYTHQGKPENHKKKKDGINKNKNTQKHACRWSECKAIRQIPNESLLRN